MCNGEICDGRAMSGLSPATRIAAPAPQLAIIWHSRTGAARAMAEAAWRGALAAGQGEGAEPAVHSYMIHAEKVMAQNMRDASAYIFVCPENLASVTGIMKDMFDRLYYDLLGEIAGRSYATLISAGSDGMGAQRQIDRIVKGWRLRRVADGIIHCVNAQTPAEICAEKHLSATDLQSSYDLGFTLSTGMGLGIY